MASLPSFVYDAALLRRRCSDATAAEEAAKWRDHWAQRLFGGQGVTAFDLASSRQQRAILLRGGHPQPAMIPVPEALQQRRFLLALAKRFTSELRAVSGLKRLSFQPMPVATFNAGGLRVHKSPVYARRQSSEYRLIVLADGTVGYARKSDHWGYFSTNVLLGTEKARAMGFADDFVCDDPYGRVASVGHDWTLEGDLGGSRSRAGYLRFSDLLAAVKDQRQRPPAGNDDGPTASPGPFSEPDHDRPEVLAAGPR